MLGGGPFGLEPGVWTDDTSMALCLADSLIAAAASTAETSCSGSSDGTVRGEVVGAVSETVEGGPSSGLCKR